MKPIKDKNHVKVVCVLIGPCGIETLHCVKIQIKTFVLIGPCGIETNKHFYIPKVRQVLIGPCGIETY